MSNLFIYTNIRGCHRRSAAGYEWRRTRRDTNFVKEIATSGKFQQHVDARVVSRPSVRLNNNGVYKFEDVSVLQGRMDLHLLLYHLAIIRFRFGR